jgi:hypothetical protein
MEGTIATMSDTTTFLLRALEENWILARQAEDKGILLWYTLLQNVPESCINTLLLKDMTTYLF